MTSERQLTDKRRRFLVWAVMSLPGVVLLSTFEVSAQPVSATKAAETARMLAQSKYERGTAVSAAGAPLAGAETGQQASQFPDKPATFPDSAERVQLPFPVVSPDAMTSLNGIQASNTRQFPSAIEVKGNARGLLLHARRETKYDLLSPVSLWLESGPLLVAVRAPSEMSLIATKFGDVCITSGADALLDRGDGTLRIVNLSTGRGSVHLVLHDRQWRNSPFAGGKSTSIKTRRGTTATFESGSVAISPGYELVVADHTLELAEAKPADAIGRRDFKVLGDNGRFVLSEVSVDNLVQVHDLVRNLREHGARANTVLTEINRTGAQYKSKQGEEGFERTAPLVKQTSEPKKADPKSKPPKAPVATVSPKKSSEKAPSPPARGTGSAGAGSGAAGSGSGAAGTNTKDGIGGTGGATRSGSNSFGKDNRS